MKYHRAKGTEKAREQKGEVATLKKIANKLSREVRTFWGQVGKLVVYKHEVQIEQIRQAHMVKHMDFMVGQTERYSASLADNLNKPAGRRLLSLPEDANDADFKPPSSEGGADDDETTIDQEEIDASLQTDEQAAVQEMNTEGDEPIAAVLAKYGVDESAAANGEILKNPEEAAEEMDVSPEDAGEDAGATSPVPAEADGADAGSDADEDLPDLSFLVGTDAMELTEEEEGLKKKKTKRMKAMNRSAKAFQPRGNTLATAGQENVLEVPFIVKAQLREYQHVALQWMMALYDKRLNGILADEVRPPYPFSLPTFCDILSRLLYLFTS
jgi:hypothetical protein